MRVVAVAALCVLCSASTMGQAQEATEACPEELVTTGCRVLNGDCVCSHECNTVLPYDDEQTCLASIRGRHADHCRPNPCNAQARRPGVCLQTASAPGYKCFCFGTGYYGDRCENDCSDLLPRSRRSNDLTFPLACIGI